MPEILEGEAANLMHLLEDPANKIVVHLARMPIPDDVDSVILANIQECNFPGYGPQIAVGFTNVETDDDFFGEAVSKVIEWIAGDIVTPQLVTAEYVTIKRGDDEPYLAMFRPLVTPIKIHTKDMVYQTRVRVQSANIAE